MPETTLHGPNGRPRSTLSDLDEGYMFCCCHIRYWAFAVGVLETISLAANFGLLISDASDLVIRIVSGVIWAIVLALLFYGMKKESPYFLIPHLVMQCLQIAGFIILAYTALSASKENIFVIVGAISLFATVIEMFFFWIILQTLKYFNEKRALSPLDAEIPAANTVVVTMRPGVSNPAFYGSQSVHQTLTGSQSHTNVAFPVGGPGPDKAADETVFSVPPPPYSVPTQRQSDDEK